MAIITALSFFLTAQAVPADPILKIVGKNFKRSELLKRQDLETVEVLKDPAYPGMKRVYKTALPAYKLFEGVEIQEDEVIQFKCTDTFNNAFSKERLLAHGPNASKAYIAIEDPADPWPELASKKHKGTTAGPFYLVWVNTELSKINPMEWPFKLSGFDVKGTYEVLYPAIFPKGLDQNHRAFRGLKIFLRTCFACHTMNKQGASSIAHDLNSPTNPLDYFHEAGLIKHMDEPKALRPWIITNMPGFKDSLTKQEKEDIVIYLKVMAGQKVK